MFYIIIPIIEQMFAYVKYITVKSVYGG